MLSATTCHHEVHEEIEGEPTLSLGGSTIAVVVLQYLHALHGRLIVRLDSPNQYLATLHTSDAKELKRNWLSVGIGFNTVPALLCVSATLRDMNSVATSEGLGSFFQHGQALVGAGRCVR